MKLHTFRTLREAYFCAKAELIEEYSWQSLATEDMKLEAIAKYAREHNCNIREAQGHVDAFLSSLGD